MGQKVFQMQQDACIVILKIVLQYLKKKKAREPYNLSPPSAVLSNEILIYDTYCSPCSWGTVKSLLFIYICSLYHMLFIKHYFCLVFITLLSVNVYTNN